ncbi:MAG: DUF3048 domain-containing protein [Acidimicrobiia bacterium]|nr:DUF3048 domain-containing protein [Acidimicrobiia bacterium]
MGGKRAVVIWAVGFGLLALSSAWADPAQAAGDDPDHVVPVEPSGRWHVQQPGHVDYRFDLGAEGDIPLLGDWDGDGIDTPGVYRPSDGSAHLTNRIPAFGETIDEPELRFFFGLPGDRTIFAGDWDGDGIDTLGLSRFGQVFLAGTNATSIADQVFWFGTHADIPHAGDPDGNGIDGIFLQRISSLSVFYATDPTEHLVADSAGSLYFGARGDQFVVGDWNGDGTDTPGVFRPFTTTVHLHDHLWTGKASRRSFQFGRPDWQAVAGNIQNHVGGTAPVSSLTGKIGANPANRVVIAKISNSSRARPQAGIAEADFVMEVIVEGGIGRWIVLYQSELPRIAGPLRSVREVDPKLIEPFDARVLHSGGQASVRQTLSQVAVDEGNGRIPGYYRDPNRRRVYDLMYDFSRLPDDGWTGSVAPVLPFDSWIPSGGVPATALDVAMTGANTLAWSYQDGHYVRSQSGSRSLDADGAPITADSVVVAYVEQIDTGRRDSANQPVPDYIVTGRGDAVVFRNGQAWPVEWVRDTTGQFFRFMREDGREIAMDPGRTWVHITPTTGSATWH